MTFVYDKDGKMLAQSNGIAFLYDHVGKIGFIYDGETYLYRKNVQGDVLALLDTDGNTMVEYTYDAWGNHRVTTVDGVTEEETARNAFVGNLNPIRYRSYYFDTDSGMYWLTTRFYDPKIGRFISQDEYSYLDPETINGLNLYAYCGDNPVMRVDPSGHLFFIALLGSIVAGAIVGAAVDAGSQIINNKEEELDMDWGSVANSAITGGVLGGASIVGIMLLGPAIAGASVASGAATFGAFAATAGVSFTAGAGGYVVEEVFNHRTPTADKAFLNGTIVMLEGMMAFGFGGVAGKVGNVGKKSLLQWPRDWFEKTVVEKIFTSPLNKLLNAIRDNI